MNAGKAFKDSREAADAVARVDVCLTVLSYAYFALTKFLHDAFARTTGPFAHQTRQEDGTEEERALDQPNSMLSTGSHRPIAGQRCLLYRVHKERLKLLIRLELPSPNRNDDQRSITSASKFYPTLNCASIHNAAFEEKPTEPQL